MGRYEDEETVEIIIGAILKSVVNLHDEEVERHRVEVNEKDNEIRELKEGLLDLKQRIKQMGGAE